MSERKETSRIATSERAKVRGPWRSREQLRGGAEILRITGDEFLPGAMDYAADAAGDGGGVSRRGFLKLLSASMAAAGLAGCKKKETEAILPYVNQPPALTPGRPKFFATTMTLGGFAQGVLATSREERPVKVEGNPDHPASLGASDVFMQASILDLYDPDRAKTVLRAGQISDWDTFIAALRQHIGRLGNGNTGLAILSRTITSPTLLRQIDELKKIYGGTRWFVHEPVDRRNVRAGLRQASGQNISAIYDFAKAKVIVSLDCDFLGEEPGHLRYSRDFIAGRRVSGGSKDLNRLYAIESAATITGSVADHRWATRPSHIAGIARQLAATVDNSTAASGWVKAVAADLVSHRGQGIVIAGAHLPAEVHALAWQMNQRLGNLGATVKAQPPVEGEAYGSLAELIAAMDAGAVRTLLIVGGNPVYDSPADLDFDAKLEAFSKATDGTGNLAHFTARLGLYDDETSLKCQWHLPLTHYLEEWSDARAYDGTVSLGQPLIDPLYGGRSAAVVLEILRTSHLRDGYEIVREFWRGQHEAGDFDSIWNASVEKGIWLGHYPGTPTVNGSTKPSGNGEENSGQAAGDEGGYEVVLRPDPCLWDGTFANNAFLQELPKPLSKLTWDNAAMISPRSAEELGAGNGDVLHIEANGRSLDVPAWILPGQPEKTITLHLGYGRWRGGTTCCGPGFNAYKLQTTKAPWILTGVKVSRTDSHYELVATHTHQTIDSRKEADLDAKVEQQPGDDDIDNRKLIRTATLEQYKENPDCIKQLSETAKHSLTLYPGYDYLYKQNLEWGMSIDLQSCIGCNACVMACQTENNSPVVGKDQVSRGREMHWIRVDTYYEGSEDAPTRAFHQPVPCMQCENAPCELVCPVGATVHDNEGLNNMVYNRCVGTRYCSNNCPYKVRRFNFLQFSDDTTESLKLMRNPEVTVRNRGVMEKCTYCIQRIVATRIDLEITQVRGDEDARNAADTRLAEEIQLQSAARRQEMIDNLQTACQQACPTRAIVFGNINPVMEPLHAQKPEKISDVLRLKNNSLDYSLLEDLTTRPRTTYLARITNPNPAIEARDVTA